MINFECKNTTNDNSFNLARVDLGMSRSFDYNKSDNFFYYLKNNYNRKMSVLKLEYINKQLIFNHKGIITDKLSCIQYLLLKYGLKRDDWKNKKINTNWIGFDFIDDIVNKILDSDNNTKFSSDSCTTITKITKNVLNTNIDEQHTIIMCILYPLITNNTTKIVSIIQFNSILSTH
jgi:hypothetical protein